MTFEECMATIHKGSVISFKEYSLDRHERKHLSLGIEGAMVHEVFPANQRLSRDTLEQYYGTELAEVDYLQLSQLNCPRVVLTLGMENNQLNIKILTLNKDFYNTGLQEISVTNSVNPENIDYEPNYLSAMKGW